MDLSAPLVIILVFFSVICHEIAHGYTAYRLGDPTAYRMGRLTFNPLPHIDIFGTIILPILLTVIGSSVLLAWAKPVPVDPRYFRRPRTGMMWVSIAGPGTNFGLAAVFAAAAHLASGFAPAFVLKAFASVALINVVLTVFNLFPVPPLDGSRIVARFLKGGVLLRYLSLEPYGMFIVFGLLYLGVFSRIAYPALDLAVRVLDLGRFLVAG
jgi:Zn-dependent protease